MKKYKFENFNIELIDPVIESLQPSFTVGAEKVDIYATLNANENKLFGVFLGQMENTDGWSDKEVMDFALAQLENFKVSE